MGKAIFSISELRYPTVIRVAAVYILAASWITVLVTGAAALPLFSDLLIFTPVCIGSYLLVERYYTAAVLSICFVHITYVIFMTTYFYLLNTTGLTFATLFDVVLAGLLLGGLGATLTAAYIIAGVIIGELAIHYQWLRQPPAGYVEPKLSGYIANLAVTALIIVAVYLVIVFFAHIVRRVIAELNIERNRLSAALGKLEEQHAQQVEAAVAVTEATTHLSSATQEQAGGAQEQATAVEQVSVSANELDKTALYIVERAQAVSELAKQVDDQTVVGTQLIKEVTDTMQSAHQTVRSVVEHSTRLSEQINEIGTILELMTSIAQETHILSLNASIEAAAAEDTVAGKRFNVIAMEVGELAARAAGATGQVQIMITQIRQAINATSAATWESMVETERSVASLGQMLELSGTLRRLAAATNESSLAIRSSVEEQRRGSTQIALSLRQIGGVAEQNAQSSQRLLLVSQQLGKLVAKLRRMETEAEPSLQA